MTADTAPPRLPNVFITPVTEPLKSPAMSRHRAQETATVDSRPAKAIVRQANPVVASRASTPGRIAAPANKTPITETITLPRRKSPHLRASPSEIHPPARFVTVAAAKG